MQEPISRLVNQPTNFEISLRGRHTVQAIRRISLQEAANMGSHIHKMRCLFGLIFALWT